MDMISINPLLTSVSHHNNYPISMIFRAPETKNICVTWELVKNGSSQAPPTIDPNQKPYVQAKV
jgi:hypothetical protein